jgi:DNA-binding transcriptional MerR regulator
MSELQINKLTKLYYSIGEVAKMFQVNASLLRFWEKEFSFEIAKKNLKGNRMYSIKEIEKIHVVYDLVKIQGYTLEGAKQLLNQKKNPKSGDKELTAVVAQLESIKTRLISLKTS